MIYAASHLAGDRRLACDVCVIGTGAGGGPVAYHAAKRGLSVIVLEAGSYFRPQDFNQIEYDMFARLYQDKAARATRDGAIRVFEGKGVGGATLVNLNVCARLPPEVFAAWRAEYGLAALTFERLGALYRELELALPVHEMDSSMMSGPNTLLKRGIDKLKLRGEWLSQNRAGCATSGFCELGCPYDAKQNSLKMFLHDAVQAGAEILADTWAATLRFAGHRVSGVDAVVRDPATGAPLGRVTIDARAVCVAAGATGTPALLKRSHTPDPRRHVGSRLWLSPSAVVAAEFDALPASWRGIPQSYMCTEFMDHAPGAEKRVTLVSSFAHPAGLSSMMSGFGQAHAELMATYPHLVGVAAVVKDSRPGVVNAVGDWGVDLDYELAPADARQLLWGLREAGRILFAAGAKRVIVPLARPLVIDKVDDLDATFEKLRVRPHDLDLTSTGPTGTVWMGDDPTRAPVGADGRYHGVDGLWIADTSLFPGPAGVPPQLTAFAFGVMVGKTID